MGRLDQLKRRVLREAVQGNAGTRPRLTSFGLTSGRHAGRAWGRRLLAGGLGLGLLLVSYALLAVVAAQRGLAPWALLVTFATGQGATPSSHGLAPEAQAPSAAPTSIDFQIFPMSVRKIALDPGHGGEDGGAVTPLGTVEKDLTLDIARRLRRLLEHNAFEVLMTREHDDTVSLAERAVRANAGGADLFVSIHVNWFKTAEARGPETYYLGPTDDPHTLQLAALENRSSGYSLGQYRQLLENVYLDVRRTQPHLLARTIQRELDRRQHTGEASPASRGVKMAPFLALVATRMPAILTEIAYLSNQEEAQLLAAPEYRQRIAQSLLQGIRAYAAALNRSAKKGSCAMSDTRDILYVGIDLGTSRSAMSASNGERHMIESYLGWPVDLVARKILKRPVLIGHDAVDQRSMLDLRRPLERGLIKEGSEKDAAAVRELLRQLVSLTGMVAPPENGSRVCAVVEAPAEALRVNKQQLRNAMKGIADSLMVVSEPFAVAYGTEALLHTMIIDIGAGTTDFCVMNGRYPTDEDQRTLDVAGDTIDAKLAMLVRERYPEAQFSIHMVRAWKERSAFVGKPAQRVVVTMPVAGKPTQLDITDDMRSACESLVPPVTETMLELLSQVEPEFQERVRQNIILAGGSSLIRGLAERLQQGLGEVGGGKVRVVSDPTFAGSDGGLAIALDALDTDWDMLTT